MKIRFLTVAAVCSIAFIAVYCSRNTPAVLASQKIIVPVSDQEFKGTWVSQPSGEMNMVIKFIFLPDHHCRLVIDNKFQKSAYENYGTYTFTNGSLTAEFKEHNQNSSISIPITSIDDGKLLDFQYPSHILGDTGNQKSPATSSLQHYSLHRIPSIIDMYSGLL